MIRLPAKVPIPRPMIRHMDQSKDKPLYFLFSRRSRDRETFYTKICNRIQCAVRVRTITGQQNNRYTKHEGCLKR